MQTRSTLRACQRRPWDWAPLAPASTAAAATLMISHENGSCASRAQTQTEIKDLRLTLLNSIGHKRKHKHTDNSLTQINRSHLLDSRELFQIESRAHLIRREASQFGRPIGARRAPPDAPGRASLCAPTCRLPVRRRSTRSAPRRAPHAAAPTATQPRASLALLACQTEPTQSQVTGLLLSRRLVVCCAGRVG